MIIPFSMLVFLVSLLLHDEGGAGHQAGLAEGLAEVDAALEGLAREVHDEAGGGDAVLGLEPLRELEERRLGRQRLHHVAAGRLQAQARLRVLRRRRWGGGGGGGGCGGGGGRPTLPRGLGLLRLPPPLLLVRLDLRLDAPLRLLVVQLLLPFARRLLDLLLARDLLL